VCKSEQNKRQYEENRVRPDAHGISKLYNDNDGILQLRMYISYPASPVLPLCKPAYLALPQRHTMMRKKVPNGKLNQAYSLV
jgi:hypothetical protein